MIPIRKGGNEIACRPEWARLNPMLSYCTRQLPPNGRSILDEKSPEPRCNRQDCLFSAARR